MSYSYLLSIDGLDDLTNDDSGDVNKDDVDDNTETVEFENHQVFVKSDFNFEDAGYMGVSVVSTLFHWKKNFFSSKISK